ncbi:hypothetical protein TRIUR3_20847 [Triticum urartu]|uniref:Uncharacterized protein n=1 Tax=Triticum urartu TaxID=4572 RepID=M7ZCF5_TRIUA|nr:hypothetical protein TRIUR3_20847 [Triticum urartu]
MSLHVDVWILKVCYTLSSLTFCFFLLACRYLPPYTTWFPFEESSGVKDQPREETQGVRLLKSTLLSQLSYLAIFVIAICITEREKLKEDPLNFNLLSIVVEVVRQVPSNSKQSKA